MTATAVLFSPASPAQTVRPLRVWVDTTSISVCGSGSFQVPLRVGSFRESDTLVGFARGDSLSGITIYVTWDPAHLDLDDLVLTSGTLASQTSVTVRKFPDEKTLEILVGDREPPYRDIFGSGRPLLLLNGRVTVTDTVDGRNGWINVTSFDAVSTTRFDPIDYRPGFIRVARDTTPQYTAIAAVETVAFGTGRLDTVAVSVQNVVGRRVRRIEFSVARRDADHFAILDTIETGTLSGSMVWGTKRIELTRDSVSILLEADHDLTAEGTIVRLVLGRSTDSLFADSLLVRGFGVTRESCIGRVKAEGAAVTGEAIRDSAVTAIRSGARVNDEEIIIRVDGTRGVRLETPSLEGGESISIRDIMGREVPASVMESVPGSHVRLAFATALPNGVYFASVRGRRTIVSKQFNIIQ